MEKRLVLSKFIDADIDVCDEYEKHSRISAQVFKNETCQQNLLTLMVWSDPHQESHKHGINGMVLLRRCGGSECVTRVVPLNGENGKTLLSKLCELAQRCWP